MDLIAKYDRPGPRYTSFPPVPFWSEAPSQDTWIEHIKNGYDAAQGLDVYIHVPYCEKLCWYCGCFRTISKNKDLGDEYVDLLIKEWSIYVEKLNSIELKVHSIHFGGGTPTFLRPHSLEKLLNAFKPFLSSDFIGAIEVDPRTCEMDHLKVIRNFGFKRISMGIQDFDAKVQKAINRIQSYEMVEKLVKNLRLLNFTSINFDLIYGLPNQSEKSILETIELVKKLSPDLIAFYSYAHLPDRLKNQKLIKEDELPTGEEKRRLYELGKKLLLDNDYIEVGLDHFAKADSYLAKAFREKKLQRSFMGYTDKKTSTLIGLGVSSISNTEQSFIQNEKELNNYKNFIDNNQLPIEKGHILSPQDKIAGKLIHDLMCVGSVSKSDIRNLDQYEQIILDLKEMESDGLFEMDDTQLKLKAKGHPFLRNIAMTFDFYLRGEDQKAKFSRTI